MIDYQRNGIGTWQFSWTKKTKDILIPRVADCIGSFGKHTTSDGWIIIDWEVEDEYVNQLKCIAWQPLPKPYGGED